MKVLHVINSLAPGGAERLAADLLPRLIDTGIDVKLYVLDGRNDVFSEKLQSRGISVTFAHKGGSSIYSPRRLFELRRYVAEEEPDILHSHLGPSFHWCTLAVSAIGSNRQWPKLITTEHAVHNRRMRILFLRGFERYCYNRHDRIVCVSVEVAEALNEWLGISTERFPVILNGIELDNFGADNVPDAQLLSWAKGRKVIAMTARFIPAKDHGTAMAALKLLPEDFAAVFIGDGPDRKTAEKNALTLGIAERCLFTGTRNDVQNLLAASDFYMQTSITEGFGLGCLEAMASGLPVVASSVGGLKSLVEGAGLLFPSGDFKACAAALLELADNSEIRVKVLAAQAARALRYSIDTSASEYRELYNELMGPKT